MQLTEFAIAWGLAGEGTAVAATAAGEAAAAAGTTAGLTGIWSTVAAATPWVLIAGGCVYAVVRCINKLNDVRGKVVVCRTTEELDTETGDAAPWGYKDHCVIKWK